ncbi:MAG: divergent polysaccharide deacetylase family protein [Pseudomonadota bacterium]
MLRGVLAGGAWGLVVGIVVLAMTSQIADWRDLTPAITEEIANATPEAGEPAVAESAPAATAPETPVAEIETPAPTPREEVAEAPALEVAPPGAPAAPADVPAPASPAPEIAALPTPTPEAGVVPQPAAPAPAAPEGGVGEVAALPEPLRPATPPTDAPAVPATPGAAADAPEAPNPAAAPNVTVREVAPSGTAPAPEVAIATPEPPAAAPAPDAAPAPGDPVATERQGLPQITAEAQEPIGGAAPNATPAPEADQVAEADAAEPPSGVPSPAPVTVRINRLPTIGDDAEPEASTDDGSPEVAAIRPEGETAEEPGAPVAEASVIDPDAPAIARNAAEFAGAEGALMSVILIDVGLGLPSTRALETVGAPVTVALDAALEDAARAARRFRERGYEVALIPNLPAGAQAQDVAVSLSVTLEEVTDAVALLDSTGSDFQTDRGTMAQVAAIASQSGLGVVTYARGLNTARRIAQQNGVPSGLVFRSIDPNTTDPLAVARALDQAAFRARQDGSAIVLVPATDPMVAGLAAWAEEARASEITLAPLSAVLVSG